MAHRQRQRATLLTPDQEAKLAEAMEIAERRAHRDRLKAAEERGWAFMHPLMGWFSAAGFEVYDAGPWKILVGKYVLDVRPRDGESPVDVFDRLVREQMSEELLRAARSATALPRGFTMAWADGAAEIADADGIIVCRIAPTSAAIANHSIEGNFLTSKGAHWDELLDAIFNPGTRYRLPDATASSMPELVAASRRLRHERALAYPIDVQLLSESFVVTVGPVSMLSEGTHRLPVRVAGSKDEFLDGHLELDDGDGVVLLVAYALEPLSFLLRAWAIAVFGAAELLCVERLPGSDPLGQARARAGATGRPVAPHNLDGRRFAFGRFTYSARLRPTDAALALAGHFVVGHRRELGPEQTASDYARRNAMRVGIVLRDGETWVKPHTRGFPEGAALSFLWDTNGLRLPAGGNSIAP